MIRSTTKGKHVEELLRESESRLKRAEKLARIGHYSFDADHGNAVWSDGLKELWGFDLDSNPPFADFVSRIHPDDQERVMTEYAHAAQAKQGFDFEYRIVRPDGSEVTVQSLGEPTIDQETGQLRYFGTMVDITERKQAAIAVRESEARLRRVIRATNDGVWDWNKITGENYFSPRWKEILGYLDHELPNIDSTFFDRLHPDDAPMLMAALTLHSESGAPMSNEIRLRHKDGSYRWVLNRGEAVRGAQGDVIGMAGTITDITETKRTMAAVEHERDRLRQILDSQFGFVAELSLNGAILEINQAPLTLMKLSRTDVLGRIFWEVGWFEPSAQSKVKAAIESAARGETFRDDIVARFPGIGRRHVEAIFTPMRNRAGNVINVVSFGVDITERKQAEEALRSSEELFRALAKIAPVGIFRTDSAGNCIYVNEHYCEISGLTPAEALGSGWAVILHPDDRVRVFEEWTQAVKKQGDFISEMRMVRPDGQTIWGVAEARAETDLEGNVIGFVGTVNDITERKLAEKQLSESNRQLTVALNQLKQAQSEMLEHERLRVLGQMAVGIAHNFNNALSPILFISDLLLLEPETRKNDEKLNQYLELIRTSADDAANVVRRLRELYRKPEHYETLQPVNLSHLVQQIVTLTEPRWKQQSRADGRPVRVETDLAEAPVIAGNEGELREVLTNLILNAVEAMPNGGTIHLSTRKDEQNVVLQVRDTGIGMTPEVRQRCFETFFTTKGAQGTGLGLATVKSILQQHNATLDLQTAPGQGTTFTIRFPMPPTPPAPDLVPAQASNGANRHGRILVVEDEPQVRNLFSEYLIRQGHTVTVAEDGRAGLEQFKAGTFDLVITDMAMPEMNGEQLAREIQSLAPNTQVILLTGFGDIIKASGEQYAGITIVLSKPVKLNDLRQAVEDALAPQGEKV